MRAQRDQCWVCWHEKQSVGIRGYDHPLNDFHCVISAQNQAHKPGIRGAFKMVLTQRRQNCLLLEGRSSLCFLALHPALTHPGDLMLTLAG